MKLLLIGSGGREHALAWKLSQSPKVETIFAVPGSDAIGAVKKVVLWKEFSVDAADALADKAVQEKIDLTVVGPEAPLVAGLVDQFQKKKLVVFGPAQAAAQLEGSKAFAKLVMQRRGIPTARFEVFDNSAAACRYVESRKKPFVVKADGLASGKGVVVPGPEHAVDETLRAIRQIMDDKQFGAAGGRVVLEEILVGEEVSVIGISDGKTVLALESAQDHKRLKDGDQGPNTGGMGAYSPAPVVGAQALAEIQKQVLEETIAQMAEDGTLFSGALYAGLMITADGPKVLEYNVRFGDPETQAILPRLKTDLAELLLAASMGRLKEIALRWDPRPAVCVVLASEGYPAKPVTGDVIEGIEQAEALDDVFVFHAGTRRVEGVWQTAGGRVLNVVAMGQDHAQAIRRAYEAAGKIRFRGKQVRSDIGSRALRREEKTGALKR